jgi:hypothetical protein
VDSIEIDERFRAALQDVGLLKVAASEPAEQPLFEEGATEEVETTQGEDEEPFADRTAPALPSSLFQSVDAHPYVLDLILLRKYGPEWLEWELFTLTTTVQNDFGSTLSEINLQKLQAVRALHLANGFWRSWEVFSPVCAALNAAVPDFDVVQVPTVSQCAVAVEIAKRIRTDVEWSDEMKTYFEVVHKFDGIFLAIEPLDFITVDVEDYPVDLADIVKRWPEVRRTEVPPQGMNVTDEQLRRLLVIHETLKESRADLRSQLALLFHG